MVRNSIRLPYLSRVQRVIVLLLAVTGIVVGLLAMHTLTAITGDHDSRHNTIAATEHTQTAAADVTAAANMSSAMVSSPINGMQAELACNGMCETGHSMANMACLLALLVLTLTLALRVIVTRYGDDLHRLAAALAAALPHTMAPRTPPSLHVLSISRT